MNLKEIERVVGMIQTHIFRNSNAYSAGMLKSHFRGSGLQFREHQIYVPGDDVRRVLRTSPHAAFLLSELPHQLSAIKEVRNSVAHFGAMAQSDAVAMRAQILGIGQDGLICRMARLKM